MERWSFRRRDIGDYMHRWILTMPWGTLRLHKILRSDSDRHLHDHPWDFTSLILRGSYVELTPTGTTTYSPGDINRKKAEDIHRLVLTNGSVWTFVVSGPKRRSWGFHTEAGWVHWREYTTERDYTGKET
jgi:hypothetical protein